MTPEAELTAAQPELQVKRVSIVIVSFNRIESLRKSLRALGDTHQVLVVDNGSTDGAATLDSEFPGARFIRLPKNFGLTKALNIGIRAAEGTYVLLLHDDTQITAENVTKLADYLETHQDAGAVCPLLTSGEIAVPCVTGAAILVRSFFLRALRQIDERYGNYGSDIELCAQVKRANRKLIILEDVPAVHEQLESPMKKGSLAGDRAVGTAVFLWKHHSFVTSILYRLKAGLGGLATFRFGLVAGALGDVKIDGTS